MLGLYLNVVLTVLGFLSLASGISFFITERENSSYRKFVFSIGLFVFFIDFGYSMMGFTPNLTAAYFFRLIGLFAIDSSLIIHFIFLTEELKMKQGFKWTLLSFFFCYLLLDLVIFGSPATDKFVRYDFYTASQRVNLKNHLFHYTFIAVVAVTLLINGIRWYRSKTTKRDKKFVLQIIAVESCLAFSAVPDVVKSFFAMKYPAFPYSLAFSVVYFAIWFGCKRHILYIPTVKNVSQEIFYSVDVPILIFDMTGTMNLCNPCASRTLEITPVTSYTFRTLFTLSDVAFLRLLTRAKQGAGFEVSTQIKAAGQDCTLSLSIQHDNTDEPFCIICTVLMNNDKEVAQ